MSKEKSNKLLTMNVDTVVRKRFEIFDVNLSSTLNLQSATWELRDQGTGTLVLNDVASVNNSDADRAGNTIRTVSMTIDLRDTDVPAGYYWLVIGTVLTTSQTDVFRYPVEILDMRGAL